MELWIDTALRARGLLVELPGRRRAARRRRLVLADAPRQGADGAPRRRPRPAAARATRATGSRTSCARAVEDGVFFAGDSAGHCLPLTAEGIRTALYFGLACGRELRAVLDGQRTREQALAALRRLLGRARAQVPLAAARAARDRPDHAEPRARPQLVRAFESRRLTRWAFNHYLAIAPPSSSPPAPARVARAGRPGGRSPRRSRARGPSGPSQARQRDREPADALLDRRLGQVGVAQDERRRRCRRGSM